MKKFSKLAALVLSAVMTLGMAFADDASFKPWGDDTVEGPVPATIEVAAWNGGWVKAATDADTVTFKVTCADAASKWDDFELFIVDGDNNKAKTDDLYFTGTVDKTEYEFVVKLADIKSCVEKGGFNIQAGQAPLKVVMTFSKAAAETPATPDAPADEDKGGDVTNVLALAGIACVALCGVAYASKKRA